MYERGTLYILNQLYKEGVHAESNLYSVKELSEQNCLA